MSDGLKVTFACLTKTGNEAATSVLLSALESHYAPIQHGALAALLDRRSLEGQHAILDKLDAHADTWRPIIDARRGRLSQALREGILSHDESQCALACRAAVWFREYDVLAALLKAVDDEGHPHTALAAQSVLQLAQQLYDELAAPRDYTNRRDPQVVRHHLTSTLEAAVKRFSQHRRLEIVEAFLMLAGRENPTLRQILSDPFDLAYLPVTQVLGHSERGGVMRLLLSGLDDPHPLHALLKVLGQRVDPRFIGFLLQRVGMHPSGVVTSSLKKIDHFAWAVAPQCEKIIALDGAAQQSAIAAVVGSNVKRNVAAAFVEYLLRHGQTMGRRAAVEALERVGGAESNHLIVAALDDSDPLVQAAALAQVRHRAIPGALSRLIEALDSPHDPICDAARLSLPEFSFPRFLAAFDVLDDAVRASTAKLVRKVDPRAAALLSEELEAVIRTRRLRALSITGVMGLASEVAPQLLRVLEEDDDHFVRREAAAVLADIPSPEVAALLRRVAEQDRNVPVREAARTSLLEVEAALGNSQTRQPAAPLPPLSPLAPGAPEVVA